MAMREGSARVTSGQRSQLTAAHNSIKTKSLNWEHIGGCQWRNDLAESQAKASKVMFWRTLFGMLRGDDPTLSHGELCAALVTVANIARGRAQGRLQEHHWSPRPFRTNNTSDLTDTNRTA